jgi:GntR family transcriptional regulator
MTIDKESSHQAPTTPGGEAAGAPVVSSIGFRLDPASGVPTYRQLVQQVEQALRLGYLARGDQLPRVKDVVSALAINPNTVLKAYRELETRGIAVGRPGQGTFVQAAPGTVPLAELTALRKGLTGWLRSASAAGLDEGGMTALFTAAMRDFLDHQDAGVSRAGSRRAGASRPTQGLAGQGQAGPAAEGVA